MANLVELTNFIVSLSDNPDRAKRFRDNPEGVIADAGLSDDTKKLLLGGPKDLLAHITAAAAAAEGSTRPKPPPTVHVSTNTNTNVNTHVTTTIIVVVL